MQIFIARHAWADHPAGCEWADDSQRPLTAEGIARYQSLLTATVERGFAPNVIASSPYLRCAETARLIAEACRHFVEPTYLDALRPGSELPPLLKWTAQHAPQSVCWVGHRPDVEHLLAALVGANPRFVRMAKGSVALVEISDEIHPGDGKLRWLLTAKMLGLKPPTGDSDTN